MTQSIQNGISTLANLFAVNYFRIPQYQRAYSWSPEPQLVAFLDDLRLQTETRRKSPTKQYFLGTFLLHQASVPGGKPIVNIVDGQQRITTSVVLVAAGLSLHEEGVLPLATEQVGLLRHNFIQDAVTRSQRLRTIAEDEPFFQSTILGLSAGTPSQNSPSAQRLQDAKAYFRDVIATDEWPELLDTLSSAVVMVYAVDSAEDATQIFELQNDRGKSLTNLEALKSFLMHSIYLYAAQSADDKLESLQTQFSDIFRTIERLSDRGRAPEEDQILAAHCAAFLPWTEKEFNNPKQLVKAIIKRTDETKVVAWIESFVSGLVQSYHSIERFFERLDDFNECAELVVLNRMAAFWPLILKASHYDKTGSRKNLRRTCRLLEVLAFRGYAISNVRADTNLSRLQIAARDFAGDFSLLNNALVEFCHLHDIDNRFVAGLDNPLFYEAEGTDGLYVLWRYENHLRGQKGRQQPPLSWRDLIVPRSVATSFSVEHVAAQANPIAETIVEWRPGEPKKFKEVALSRLGNLVIDSFSANASKGKKDFTDKLKSLSEDSIYLSQGELIRFARDPGKPEWDLEAIRSRHEELTHYCLTEWDPSKWLNYDPQ
jgi:hypothetical protein